MIVCVCTGDNPLAETRGLDYPLVHTHKDIRTNHTITYTCRCRLANIFYNLSLMKFIRHVDRISMELSSLYFSGVTGRNL